MNKSFLLALAAALLAAPLALGHTPAGTTKNYCEDPLEWNTHDYSYLSTGLVVFTLQDGNLAGDCDGDTVPTDFDAHLEWAIGGAWLMVESGDGVTSGSVVCYGAVGDHPTFGPISVTDIVLGPTVPFSIQADTVNLVPPTDPAEPNCGDFTTDDGADCVGSCLVTFPSGLDGAYIVYVGDALDGTPGTGGHIQSP